MKLLISAIAMAALLTACQQPEADPKADSQPEPNASSESTSSQAADFASEDAKVSYSMGANVGGFFSKELENVEKLGISIDKDLLMQGMQDALAGESKLTDEEIQQVMVAFSQRTQELAAASANEKAEKNKQESEAFLTANATKEGVETLESGLQYKVIEAGEEGDKPAATDIVKVHYRGTLVDGTEFDSSYARNEPIEFPVNGVIKGWTDALQLMNKGAKWELYIPADQAYGDQDRGPIPANSALIFEVELLEFRGADEPAADQ